MRLRQRGWLAVSAALLGAAACAQILDGDNVIIVDPPDASGPGCQAGELECRGAALRVCRQGGLGFRTIQVCSTPELCCSGAGCPSAGCLEPACAEGDYRCDGAELFICNESQTGWDRIDVCASPAQCNASRGRCTAEPCVSTPGDNELQCNGSSLEACTVSGWQPRDTCETYALCSATPPGECRENACAGALGAGALLCSNADLQRCNDRKTGFEHVETCATPANCLPELGGCTEPPCTPGTHQCDGARLARCDINRTRYADAVEVCASPSHCNASEGRCMPDACAPGQHQCSGNDLLRCDAERSWALVQRCPSGSRCDASAAACLPPTCYYGDYRCDGNVLFRCNAAGTGWVPVHECGTTELCDEFAKRCDEPRCDPGQRRCSRDGKLQICSSGRDRWLDERDCLAESMLSLAPNDLVVAGLCDPVGATCSPQPSCPSGAVRCNGQFLERCEGNTWHPWERCAAAGLCDPSGSGRCVAPSCDRGAHRCVDAGGLVIEQEASNPRPALALQACNTARTGFETVADCARGYCDPIHGQCDLCVPYELSCSDGVLSRCSADGREWELERRCPMGCAPADAGAPMGRAACLETGDGFPPATEN